MRDVRRTEQHIARTNCGYRVLNPIVPCSGCDEIKLIALMGNLRSISGPGSEPNLKITVYEHFRRSPGRPREIERGGKREWRRRAVPVSYTHLTLPTT